MNRGRIAGYATLYVAYAIMFALGVAIFARPLGSWDWGEAYTMLICLGSAAGIVEAVATMYTGKRRLVWAWLPPVTGVVGFWVWSMDYTDPDLQALWPLFIMLFLAHICVFVVLTHATAECILWLRQTRVWPKRST